MSRATQVCQANSNAKSMLIYAIDTNGSVYTEAFPPNQTFNHTFCLTVMKSLCDSAKRKRPEHLQSTSGGVIPTMDIRTPPTFPIHTVLFLATFFFISPNEKFL